MDTPYEKARNRLAAAENANDFDAQIEAESDMVDAMLNRQEAGAAKPLPRTEWNVSGYTIKRTRSRLWGTCYKIIDPTGRVLCWGTSSRDPIYHHDPIGAYWYIIRSIQDTLYNKLDRISY